jgi:hypothetical protein
MAFSLPSAMTYLYNFYNQIPELSTKRHFEAAISKNPKSLAMPACGRQGRQENIASFTIVIHQKV